MPQTFDKTRMAEEELELSRNLRNLSELLNGFDDPKQPTYLLRSISNLEERLKFIRNVMPA